MTKYLLFLLMAACLLSCGQGDNPVEPELDYDFSEIGPLLNSDVAREFVESPWDVDMNGKINLSDLVLLTTHQKPLSAPNVPPVKGSLKKGTVLSNGFYQITIKDLVWTLTERNNAQAAYSNWHIRLEIKNIGDDRGLVPQISSANFRFRIKDQTIIEDVKWIGNVFLGESIDWIFFKNYRANPQPKYDYSKKFGMGLLYFYDTITFQATTDMIHDGIIALPAGSPLGAPIVFEVVPPTE